MPAAFPLERFLNIRSAVAPTFSPDGQSVAFLTNITGVAQVWQMPVTGGWPVQLTFARDSVRSATYSPVKPELVYTMDTGGNERTQLYLLRGNGDAAPGGRAGWKSLPLAPAPQAVHQFGGFSPDGSQIVFSANRDDASRFDVYILTFGDQEPRRLAQGPGGYFRAVGFSPDGKSVLVQRLESNVNHDLSVIDVASGELKPLTPHDGDAIYDSPVWSNLTKSVYCATTAGGSDMPGLAEIALDGNLTWLATPEYEVEAVEVSPVGEWLAWRENVGGFSDLRLRHGPKGETITLPRPGPGLVSNVTFAPDGQSLAFVFEGPRANADVWLWSPGQPNDVPRQLTRSSRAGLPFAQFAEPELIEYKTFDGRMIPAWFYRPAGVEGQKPPVIVYPHGGPESQTRPTFNALFQYFVSAGYGLLAPNVRGSSGYGTAYMNLDNVRKRLDSVKDLAHAAFWLRDSGQADPKRLAVFGGSYGGFMVLAAVTRYPELWSAGIDVVGIANFITFLERTGAYRRSHREKEYGSLTDDRAFLEEISPLRMVDQIRCPMMVIHGANDPRVPIDEAEQIVAALKERKVPVEYLRYEDEGHGLAKLENRLDAYPKMVAFLDRYLAAK